MMKNLKSRYNIIVFRTLLIERRSFKLKDQELEYQ